MSPAPAPPAAPGRARFATVAVLTGVTLIAAATATPWTWVMPAWFGSQPPPPPPEPTATATTAPPPEPEPLPRDGGFPLGDILLVVAAILTLVLLVLAARALLARARDRAAGRVLLTAPAGDAGPGTDADDVVPHLRDAVRDAHDELTDTVPPRDAIVAAWVHLEDAAALAGARRDPAQTPSEYVVLVLDRTPADPRAVTTLRDLYHRARFRDGDVDARDVEAARAALARLDGDLSVDASGSPTERADDERTRP